VGRADDLRDAHDAELAVVELEDELVRLKGLKRQDQAKLRETKDRLREARDRFRAQRSGEPAAPGDAVARPATVEATARATDLGGDA
jgi:hypothetical protein